jgi:hypothetical protein
MSFFSLRPRKASMVWLEPFRVHAGGQTRSTGAFPSEDDLAQALTNLAPGPTQWIVDDSWAPAALFKDFMELPSAAEARDSFFRWRYSQHLLLDEPQTVQALDLNESGWLLVGIPSSLLESWLQLALRMGKPIHELIPRWLWLYNQIAPSREKPGMLLSLCPDDDGRFTGTIAAWGRTLTLLRQWDEPASTQAWVEERIAPTSAFLQREAKAPQELLVWGVSDWPESTLATRVLPTDIPVQEAL